MTCANSPYTIRQILIKIELTQAFVYANLSYVIVKHINIPMFLDILTLFFIFHLAKCYILYLEGLIQLHIL